MLFQLLIDENGLMPEFAKHGLGAADIQFVQELVLGSKEDAPEGWVWHGRNDPKKAFLFDIVANKRNGIDVDKFDYFVRDLALLRALCGGRTPAPGCGAWCFVGAGHEQCPGPLPHTPTSNALLPATAAPYVRVHTRVGVRALACGRQRF